jgi:alkanesulfonate monooxygenase SsuD/methylene tetrahydromethanopterin reductase-like flavin-dependent oxidoreductase (luciferase family)
MSAPLTIGFATPVDLWRSTLDEKHHTLARLADAGVDQLYMADHVSFRSGHGTDGFCEIAALSQLHSTMRVMISVYLLALRHPLPVARQIATMSTIAPERFSIGVGVGGEDRHEIEICGVDPATRGRRTDDSLEIIRRLMAGESVTHHGDFFSLDEAIIRPAVVPPPPILIGGRSNAALTRAARFGDGWIGAWCSPRRFAEATSIISAEAVELGRTDVEWIHGYQPWIGVGDSKGEARVHVAAAMEAFYHVPFEAFEKYTPYGTPAEVAAELQPYVDAGCSMLNLKIVAGSDDGSIDAAAEIVAALRS